MKRNEQEKSLAIIKENRIFARIRNFFRKKKTSNKIVESIDKTEKTKVQREKFKEYVKTVENGETRLLKLQKKYRNGEIKEKDLTPIQIKALCDLYDKQIKELQKAILIKRQY